MSGVRAINLNCYLNPTRNASTHESVKITPTSVSLESRSLFSDTEKKTLFSKFQIPIDKMDFDYLSTNIYKEQQNDTKVVREKRKQLELLFDPNSQRKYA